MSFTSLNLCPPILRAIEESGYTQPTPIQGAAIPAVLAGGDLMAMAQTGTGKTAGFVLPILQLLSTSKKAQHTLVGAPAALILVPTRELALQVLNSVKTYGKYLPLQSMSIIGGVSINPQIKQLHRKLDILIATPGRLLDHIKQKTLDLSKVNMLVLDEADRMLDMGFIPDIRKIMRLLPVKCQNMLFSATFSDEIKVLADSILKSPSIIEVAKRNTASAMISHKVHPTSGNKKKELLAYLIIENSWHQVLVFTRTKYGADKLAHYLDARGLPALAIHGNKSQGNRSSTLAKFKNGSLQVLVATDIAARGLDIVDLPYVVNFDLPKVAEDYIHRIGRTGRAGQRGYAVSLVAPEEKGLQIAIERLLKNKITEEVITGFEHALPIPSKVLKQNDAAQNNTPPRDRKPFKNKYDRQNKRYFHQKKRDN